MPDYADVVVADRVTVNIYTDGLPPGGSAGQILVKLSSANYHVAWSSIDAITRPIDADSIEELLALPADTWFRARVFNTYDAPVLTYWDLILKTSPMAVDLVANGDSILETDDGLAYAVRIISVAQA